MAEIIHILDKDFEISINHETIQEKIKAVAAKLDKDYAGKNPIMICILNGAFVFAADLARYITTFQPELLFAKFSSYDGTETTGKVKELIGVNADLNGRDVIIVEDIVDTGITMADIIPTIKNLGAKTVSVCTLLTKPEKLQVNLKIDYAAMEIPNDFIVGYGLDYDGYGRNYKDIYKIVNSK